MRHYIAHTDAGHDYGAFVYASDHRAGSRANYEDALAAASRKYGALARHMAIVSVARCDAYGNEDGATVPTRKFW